MTLDLISRAEARIAEIDQQRRDLEFEQNELETAIKVLHRFLDESTDPIPSNSGPSDAKSADLSTAPDPAQEPQPSPAAQTDTTAPKPLSEGQGDSATAPLATDGELEHQPAEAKTVDQEPLSNGSGGVQDRCESTPPTSSPSLHISDLPEGGENEVAAPTGPFDRDGETSDALQSPPPAESRLGSGDTAPSGETVPATAKHSLVAGDKSVEPAGSAAPSSVSPAPVTLTRKIVRKSVKREIFERCHAEHPDWPVKLIVEHTGLPKGTVTGYAAKLGIKMPSLAEYKAAQRVKTTEALKVPAPAEPPSAPTAGSAIEPKPITLKERIIALREKYPDWTARQAADYLKAPFSSVRAYGAHLGFKWPTAKPAEPEKARAEPEPAAPVKPASTLPAEPLRQVQTRPVMKPKGTQFYLRDRATGYYLHCSVTLNKSGTPLLTAEKAYAWQGTEAHMLAVRKKMPATIDMREVVVE